MQTNELHIINQVKTNTSIKKIKNNSVIYLNMSSLQ